MAVKFSVEPFDARSETDWQTNTYYLVIDFFGTEVFRIKVKHEYISEYDLDDAVEVAKQELGALLEDRLSARIKTGEYEGIKIESRN